MRSGEIYFPSLNGIRFIAAFLVIVHHVEQFKLIWGYKNFYYNPAIKHFGGLGVTLFFVLSGYLITMLLLIEKNTNKRVQIQKFYLRRVFRIWPLYYFSLLLAFCVLPFLLPLNIANFESPLINFGEKVLFFFFMLPNLALIIYPAVPFAAHLWSVGVEEQFYLFWPFLFKGKTQRLIIYFILIVILMFLVRNGLGVYIHYHRNEVSLTLKNCSRFLNFFRIDCMAIGGIGAWIFNQKKKKILQVVFHPIVQISLYISLLFCLFTGLDYPAFYLNDVLYSICFVVILMNLSTNKETIISLENKIFNYLGRISFGLYVFHSLAIALVLLFVKEYAKIEDWELNLFIYLSSILLTILFASISYYFLEAKFLDLKKKFMVVKSNNKRNDSF